jgi:hypothetical protein
MNLRYRIYIADDLEHMDSTPVVFNLETTAQAYCDAKNAALDELGESSYWYCYKPEAHRGTKE